jgi:outer membrane protein assembly factor BamD
MQKNSLLKIFLVAVSALIIVSCSEYEKVLKSNDYDFKYRKAVQYYEKKDYARAITIFEQIVSFYRASVKGDSVMYMFAQSYYGDEDYVMAGFYFKELSDNYARSPFVEEADYLVGYCHYLVSPRASLDQENTNLSMAAFQKFIYKHPSSKYTPECKRLIKELQDKLAEKAYLSAKLYYDLKYYKAAIISLNNCITQYPESSHREKLMFMLLDAKYELALNSVQEKQKERFQNALDEYYSYVSEYPKGEYDKQVTKIFNKTKEVLGL